MHIEKGQSPVRVLNFLAAVDGEFVPPVSSRVDLEEYAAKLSSNATNLFAVDGHNDIGHAAFYSNALTTKVGFVSSFAVKREYRGTGVGTALLDHVILICRNDGMNVVTLEVAETNLRAIEFYKGYGFSFQGRLMQLDIT